MEKGFCLVGLRHHWEDRSLSVSRILLSVCSQKPSRRGIFLQKYIIFTNGIYMGDMDTHRWCVRAGVSPPKRDKTESRSLCVQTSAPGRYRLCPELGGRGYMQWEDLRIRSSTASGMVSQAKASTQPSLSSLILFSKPSLQMKVLHCSSLMRWGNTIHGFVWHFPGNSQKHMGNWKKV